MCADAAPTTRLMLVTGSYPADRCGVGDYTCQLASALARLPSTEVSVLTSGSGAVVREEAGVMVRRSIPDWSLASWRPLLRELRAVRPQVVHVQYPTQGYGKGALPWLVPALSRLLGARVVQTWHEGFSRRHLPGFLAMALTPGRTIVVRKAWLRHFLWPLSPVANWRRPSYIKSASTLPKSLLGASEVLALRLRLGADGRRLIVFFGFVHPAKRIELLFEVADPQTDHVLVIGNIGDQTAYAKRLEALASEARWRGHARIGGFVDRHEAADILKAADAIVLPLEAGGGEWNTAILAGVMQGTFVLTTSATVQGYDPQMNIYYAPIDDVAQMREALQAHAGRRRQIDPNQEYPDDWGSIARSHLALYGEMLASRPKQALANKADR